MNAAVLRHRIATVLTVDETDALAKILLPTLIIGARGDRVIPRASTIHLVRTLAHARHVELDGPHLVLQTRPALCATIITEFMTECVPGTGARLA